MAKVTIKGMKNKEPCDGCFVLPVCLKKKTCFALMRQCSIFYQHVVKETEIFEAEWPVGTDPNDGDIIDRYYVSPNLGVTILLKKHKLQKPKDGVQVFFYDKTKREVRL